jgi:chemotaxis protein methyltransferase CheR
VITATHRLANDDYLRFRDLILDRSGLHFPEQKRNDFEIGLLKAWASAPDYLVDINAYYHFLQEAATPIAKAEIARLINHLTVGETRFFRNEAQFDALKNHILPELIWCKRVLASSSGSYRPDALQLRFWSAGCATGEEPYSLAMLLRQLIPDIDQWHILIWATDINENFLTQARRGVYPNWSFREPNALAMRSQYFTRREKYYQLQDNIRQMVTFARHNLITDMPVVSGHEPHSFDLIICRNVTIYFDNETTRQVIDKFYNALTDGGWLAVGHSEPSLIMHRRFQAKTFPQALFYQKCNQPTLPHTSPHLASVMPSRPKKPAPRHTLEEWAEDTFQTHQ